MSPLLLYISLPTSLWWHKCGYVCSCGPGPSRTVVLRKEIFRMTNGLCSDFQPGQPRGGVQLSSALHMSLHPQVLSDQRCWRREESMLVTMWRRGDHDMVTLWCVVRAGGHDEWSQWSHHGVCTGSQLTNSDSVNQLLNDDPADSRCHTRSISHICQYCYEDNLM